MNIHVLPGDALTENFADANIEGEIVVCRECLVDGDVKADDLADFWNVRAAFIASSFGETKEKYFQGVAGELEKLRRVEPDAEINLWFEHELFCQTNMWFCLWLLSETRAKVFRVAPLDEKESDVWKGFVGGAADLRRSFASRIRFSDEEIALGANLWRAFQSADYEELERLSQTESACFPHLAAVCRAAIEKNSRPQEILRAITAGKSSDFAEIFSEFSRRAGVYGFGDAQVARLLREI